MFIWNFVASTVLEAILDWLYDQIIGFLGNFFAVMGDMGVELLRMDWVQSVILFFHLLGWALYAVGLVLCVFEFAIQYSSGRADIKGSALNVLKGFMAVSLFTLVPVRLYEFAVSLQGLLTNGLTNFGDIGALGQDIVGRLTTTEGLIDGIGNMNLRGMTNPCLLIFCVIAMAYAVIKVFFANLKRGGILLIQIAVGSLYMFSIPRGYTDGFMQWCKQVIGLCLTAFLQSTILVAGLLVFRDHLLLGLGLMLSAGEVPRIAGTFGLDTTTRANIMSAVYTAQTAINTTKTIAAAVGK